MFRDGVSSSLTCASVFCIRRLDRTQPNWGDSSQDRTVLELKEEAERLGTEMNSGMTGSHRATAQLTSTKPDRPGNRCNIPTQIALKNGIWGGGVVLQFHFKLPFLQSCFLNDQYSSSFHVIGKQVKIKYLGRDMATTICFWEPQFLAFWMKYLSALQLTTLKGHLNPQNCTKTHAK